MWKKGLVISVTVVALLITGGCAGVDFSVEDSESSPTAAELYVNVETGEADIILLDSEGQILKYEENCRAVKFTNLRNTNYQVIIGKIGYSLFKKEVTVDGESNLDVNLEKVDKAPVTAEVSVTDETGTKMSDFTAGVYKNGDEIATAESIDKVASLPVWPGVIYDYKVTKQDHVAYRKADAVYLEASGTFTLEGSLMPSKQTFSAGETKQLNLGTLADNETAVVAVSPLNFNPQDNNTVDGQLKVDYSSTVGDSSLVKLAGNEDAAANTEVRAVQSRPEVNNQAQQLLDQQMRMLGTTAEIEQQVASEAETSLRLNSGDGSELELGTEKSFYVMDNLRSTSFSQIQATLQKKDDHVYVFVEKGVNVDSKKLDQIKAEFNNRIYENNLEIFALSDHEYNQSDLYDIDGNGRPIILITNLQHLSKKVGAPIWGAFSPWNYFDKSTSNKADMIYINSYVVQESKTLTSIFGTLAHEFQHLIYFVEKNLARQEAGQPDKRFTDIWLNEGLSGLAEYLNGYYSYTEGVKVYDARENSEQGYFNNPAEESLFYWNQKLSDYGASYLFVLYLYDQYGAEIIQEINTTYRDPRQVIADFTGQNLSSLFLDWALTNQITNDNISDKYSYSLSDHGVNVNLASQPETKNISNTSTDRFSVKPSGVQYYQIEGTGQQVELEINDFDQKTGVVIYRE